MLLQLLLLQLLLLQPLYLLLQVFKTPTNNNNNNNNNNISSLVHLQKKMMQEATKGEKEKQHLIVEAETTIPKPETMIVSTQMR